MAEGRLARKALVGVAGNLVGALLGYATLLAIGRFVDPEAYGSYAFATSLVGVFALVANLGLGQTHAHHVGKGTDLATAVGVHVRLRAMLLVAFLGILGAASFLWFVVLGKPVTDATTMTVVAVVVGTEVLSSLRKMIVETWVGQMRVVEVETVRFVDTLLSVTLVVLTAGALAAATGRWVPFAPLVDSWGALVGIDGTASVPKAAVLLATMYLVGKAGSLLLALGMWLRRPAPVGRWDPVLARTYVTWAVPLAATAVMGVILQYSDSLMLGYFWSAKDVGWYTAAIKLGNFTLIPTAAALAVLFPYFSGLQGAHRTERAWEDFRTTERLLLLYIVPIGLFLFLLPRQVIHVAVGDAFLPGADALRWLALWAVIMAMHRPLRTVFLSQGNLRCTVRATTLNMVLNVMFNLWFIPTSILGVPLLGLGLKGAALATLLSTIASYLYLRLQARRELDFPLLDGVQVRFGLVLLGVGFAAHQILQGLNGHVLDRWWELATAGILLAVASWSAALLLRLWDHEDVRLLWHAVRGGRSHEAP